MVGSLELSTVGPSHYEITMVTVTSGISICKSKFVIFVHPGGEEELIEKRKDGFWV